MNNRQEIIYNSQPLERQAKFAADDILKCFISKNKCLDILCESLCQYLCLKIFF